MAGGASLIPSAESLAGALKSNVSAAFEQAVRGTAPVKIRDIKTILTAPNRIRLVVVKVETTEPGLVGWGCATFTQRSLVVQTALNDYLRPFLIGRNVDEIEDIWQSSYMSSYWRNGPVLFNAMSGVDIALWDIKGKRAGMPLYQLLGGKVRHGADCYYHASGASFEEVEANARAGMERGFRHVRVQVSTPGYASYGARSTAPAAAAGSDEVVGPTNPRAIWEPAPYCRMLPKFFEYLRSKLGDEVELLHDVHERVTLNQGINLCKSLEPYRLFFLEDPFPPEDNDHFRLLRQQTSTPIAMGELFNTQHEYVPLIKDRLIDFIRIHISQIGGLSPARKVAALSEFFGVRTAWHGPGDASPLAHAAQLALELASYNFGVHEGGVVPEGDAGSVCRLSRGEGRLHARAGKTGPGNRGGREAGGEVPDSRWSAELRLLVGNDAPEGWDGDQAMTASSYQLPAASSRLRTACSLSPQLAAGSGSWQLSLGLEVEHHPRADRGDQEAEIQHRIDCRLRRMDVHRVQHVHERRSAEDERHDVGRRATGPEREDDADGAERAECTGDRRFGRAFAVEPAQPLSLTHEHDERNEHADQEVGDAHAEQRSHRAAQFDLPAVQHRAIDAPRRHCSRHERQPRHVCS